MAITEEARHRLYRKLEATIGAEEAAILMEHLPPVGWADVATKRDLDQLAFATRRDLDQVRTEMEHLGSTLRTEMEHLGSTLRTETEHLGLTLRTEMEQLGSTLRAEIRHESDVLRVELASGLRSQLQWVLGYVTVLNGALFAALKLTA